MKKNSILAFVLLSLSQSVFSATLDETILDLQRQWAVANYETPEKEIDKVFEKLTITAQAAVKSFPNKAEPLVWNAIIVSTYAGKSGGLSALSKVKEARRLLLEAEKIDPNVLNGSIYSSLGSLYYQVPGWPIGFGDDEQAEKYLQKALAVNPDGIDSNYFYADFMLDQDNKKEAKKYFTKALKAAPRPRRPLADKGRQAEIKAKLMALE